MVLHLHNQFPNPVKVQRLLLQKNLHEWQET
jgi:hypothetical protein